MKNNNIAFIGAGNMARCLINGLINGGFNPHQIWASSSNAEKLARLHKQYQIHTTQDNVVAIEQVDIIILAVKPQVLPAVAKELAHAIDVNNQLIISLAAGVRTDRLQQWINPHLACIRCMPNTPALVGSGACGLYANGHVSDDHNALAESILRTVGVTVWLDHEHDLDTVTALSGSGPAYFLLVMEALEQAAAKQGLSPQTAHLLTLQTALGAAHLAMESNQDLAQLRDHVTSPGGTTEQAIKVLEVANIRDAFAQAIDKARQRSIELSELINENQEEV